MDTLEARVTPAVSFSRVTGHLSVTGDESGPFADKITAGVTASGFVEIRINGIIVSVRS